MKKTHCIINLVINAFVEPTVTIKDLPSSEFTNLLSCNKLRSPPPEIFNLFCDLYR